MIARALGFVATAYLARALGPAAFGIVGFAYALAGYFAITIHQGFLDIGSREIARRPEHASALASGGTLARLGLATVLFVVLAAMAFWLDKPMTVKLAVLIMGLSTFTQAFDTSWVYKGLERNRPVGAALIAGQALFLGVVLIAVHGPSDVLFVPSGMVLGELGAAAILGFVLVRTAPMSLDWSGGLNLLRTSALPTLGLIFLALVFTFDVVLIGFIMDNKDVGLYTAPYRIIFLLVAVSVAVRASYLPAVTRAAEQGMSYVAHTTKRALEMNLAIGIPAVIGGAILAVPLLTAVFGPEYTAGARAFQILLVSIALIYLHATIHNVFVACNKLKQETVIIAVAAILNVVLNIIFIPRFGLVGAAGTTVVAHGFILIAGLVVLYRMGVHISFWPLVKAALPAGIMGAILITLGPDQLGTYSGLTVNIVMGAAIYALLLIAFRSVPKDLEPALRGLSRKVRGIAAKA